MKDCTFPDCGRPVQGYGYCTSHLRQKRKGETLRPIRTYSSTVRPCSFEGCEIKVLARGLCSGHYRQQYKMGYELTPLLKPRGQLSKTCEFDGCDRPHNSNGLCMGHNVMLKRSGQLAPLRVPKGRWVTPDGYVKVVARGHSEASAKGVALEHRLVMADTLGRPLLPGENVHHINGVRDDNRPENLELWVTMQPTGQRTEDLVEWAYEILARYGGADAQRFLRSRTIPLFRRPQAA